MTHWPKMELLIGCLSGSRLLIGSRIPAIRMAQAPPENLEKIHALGMACAPYY